MRTNEAIINFITVNDTTGVTNAQIAEHLALRSAYGSGVKDYIIYSKDKLLKIHYQKVSD